jgi:outer membrane protein insertion porin family
VRFPLPFIPDDLGMRGAVFADAGSLFGAGALAKGLPNECPPAAPTGNGICLADSQSIRTSVGVSLIWNSPLGPLRLDYAQPLTKESYDDTQFIRFGAATKF